MLGVEPEVVAHDLHPEYLATKWALEQGTELVGVQHHHAHAAACLAEHGETGPALALVFDGTGYGTDGTLWGGELLRCDLRSFERLAHLDPVPLPGGEAAIREPWRIAAVCLELGGLDVPWERWPLVRESLKVNAPLASGMGRLFDAVAAVLGVREQVTYEGQAAVELEHLAGELPAEPFAWRFGDTVDLATQCYLALEAGRDRAEVAAAFHETVAAGAAAACAEAGEPRTSSFPAAASRTGACSPRRAGGSRSSDSASSRTGSSRRTTAGSATGRRRSQLRGSRHVPRDPSADRRDHRLRGRHREGRDLGRAPGDLGRALPRGRRRRLGARARRLRAGDDGRGAGEGDAGAARADGRGIRAGGRRDPGERGRMSLDAEHCITCGDVAVTATVVSVSGDTATVEVDGRREQVGIELVSPVEPGEALLCHAGIALQKVEAA